MPLNDINPSRGKVLLAEPMLKEPYFKRAVVLLTEHNEQGTVGFVFNKPMGLGLKDCLPELDPIDFPVYLGGPVSRDNLFFFHTLGSEIPGSLQVKKDLYWGGDFEALKKLLKEGRVTEDEVRFFVGYSGWEPGQLDRELKENSWMVAPATTNTLLKDLPADLWKNIVKTLEGDLALLFNFPEDPSEN